LSETVETSSAITLAESSEVSSPEAIADSLQRAARAGSATCRTPECPALNARTSCDPTGGGPSTREPPPGANRTRLSSAGAPGPEPRLTAVGSDICSDHVAPPGRACTSCRRLPCGAGDRALCPEGRSGGHTTATTRSTVWRLAVIPRDERSLTRSAMEFFSADHRPSFTIATIGVRKSLCLEGLPIRGLRLER
jgi:hypothetical protein